MVVQQEKTLVTKRVLYIGSSVPMETAAGIEAVQQPLKDRYPTGDETKIQGIDALVSITTSGITLQYVEDSSTVICFPIGALTLCAAVRHVKTVNGATGDIDSRFVSLTSPQAKGIHIRSPAIFTAITRRTKGRKVLECHGFLCANDSDAMDLVRATSAVDKSTRGTGTTTTQMTEQQTRTLENRFSVKSENGYIPNGTLNGTANGHIRQVVPSTEPIMRLKPGNTMPKAATTAPKEFYEPPPPQGYFYSSAKTEVKQFNIEKEGGPDISPRPPTDRPRTPSPRPSLEGVTIKSAPAYSNRPPPMRPMQPNIFVRGPFPPPPPSMMRRTYTGPPPPGPPPPGHPPPPHTRRFLSPPPRPLRVPPPPHPSMMRPPPPHFMGPPPPPVFVRRHRRRSVSSGSTSSSPRSRDSSPKRVNRESDSETSFGRPRTPPRDYEPEFVGERLSRKEQHERKKKGKHRRPMSPPPMFGPMPGNAYYVYSNPYGPSMPFPFGRSQSVPPYGRYPSPEGRRKHKKNRKSKKRNGEEPNMDESRGKNSDYEQPRQPRDFRREENQFLNERNFSKSIHEGYLKPDENNFPTAYELNNDVNNQFMLY